MVLEVRRELYQSFIVRISLQIPFLYPRKFIFNLKVRLCFDVRLDLVVVVAVFVNSFE